MVTVIIWKTGGGALGVQCLILYYTENIITSKSRANKDIKAEQTTKFKF